MAGIETPEPEVIRAIRAGDAQKAWGLLIDRKAHLSDKSRDGETAYELAMRIGDAEMQNYFRVHLVCG
jgi:ankyrin repeat protein